jgi:uncharacterized protein
MNTKLIEFSCGNFRSFKEPVTLSMVAAKLNSRNHEVDENNTIRIDDTLTLLTTTALYGANASGKSNLIKAMDFMRRFVIISSKESQADEPIRISPFKLCTDSEDKPSFFEVVFLLENMRYRYGFEANRREIISEWLFHVPTVKEARLFVRDQDGIRISKDFKEGRGLEDKTRKNALFLSVVAQFNGAIATAVISWFKKFRVISGLDDRSYRSYATEQFEKDEKTRAQMIELVKKLDLGIDDLTSRKLSEEEFQVIIPDAMPSAVRKRMLRELESERLAVQTVHQKYDKEGEPVSKEVFRLKDEESDGTEKLFYLTAPLLDILNNGMVLAIDEMEARLHPLITKSIIELFHSLETNPNRAQLIFTTHDTNLLSNKQFRRDQIWFVEKNRQGASTIYSLAELKVRNDASFEKDYIEGRYGAIPFLGELRRVIQDQ